MQNNMAGQFQQMISARQNKKDAMMREEKEIDRYIAERDREDYQKFLQAAEERKKW